MTDWSIDELSDFDRACTLRAAAVNERLSIIDQLLAAGTPIDAEVDGQPAIHWAREQGRSKAVEHLANVASRLPGSRAGPIEAVDPRTRGASRPS